MRVLLDWLSERHRGHVLLLLAAVLAVYLPWIGNSFFFDDLPFFTGQPSLRYWSDQLLRPRGIPYLSLQFTWLWFGADLSHAYHLVDALLHAANAIALFYLLKTLCGLHLPERKPADLAWACMLACLIFALHPVATYAAGYVIQRSILMATFFSLLAQLAWVKAWTTGQLRMAALAMLLYLLATFSKEHAVALPAVLCAISLLMWRSRRLNAAAIAASVMTAVGIALYVASRRADVVAVSYEPMSSHMFSQAGVQAAGPSRHFLSIATQAGMFFRYLLLWLLPTPAWMSIDMRADFLARLGDWRVAAGLLSYVGCGVLGLRLLLKKGSAGLIGLALLAPLLLFVVEFASIRVQEVFVLYRSYLWMPLLMLLPALSALRLMDLCKKTSLHASARWLAPLLVILCLAPAATNRLAVAADSWTLWDDAARLLQSDAVPGADRILYNRGQAALGAGKPGLAVADLERVARISPEFWQVWKLLGAAHLANGQTQLAQEDFARALHLQPGDGGLLYAQAIALRRNGQPQLALNSLQASCKAAFAPACVLVGRLQFERQHTGATAVASDMTSNQ